MMRFCLKLSGWQCKYREDKQPPVRSTRFAGDLIEKKRNMEEGVQ